jgi:hypothetical protein
MKHYPIIAVLLFSVFHVSAHDHNLPVNGKIVFSNQPLTNGGGGKKQFNSGEYIYGRLELTDGTLNETFKIKEKLKGYPYIGIGVAILKGEETVTSYEHYFLLLKESDKNSRSLSFDILPEPNSATSMVSMMEDFRYGNGHIPFSSLIISQRLNPGKYTIRVWLYNRTEDGWGKELDREEWPRLQDEFEYEFREQDIARVKKDYDLTVDLLQENAFRYDKMPDIFTNGAVIKDPKATNASILSIVKRDLPRRTILKMAIEKTGTIWSIAKDDYGLPKYRYFYPTVHVAYKLEGKCYIGTVTLRQTYTGGGTFGALEVGFTSDSETGGDRGIDCAKVK